MSLRMSFRDFKVKDCVSGTRTHIPIFGVKCPSCGSGVHIDGWGLDSLTSKRLWCDSCGQAGRVLAQCEVTMLRRGVEAVENPF